MRSAGGTPHGLRTRALTVLLWRARLRISEALSLAESDLDAARGSILVRAGQRRETTRGRHGPLDLATPRRLARNPHQDADRRARLCHRRTHPRPTMVTKRRPCHPAPARRHRRGTPTLRAPPAPTRPRHRDGPRRCRAERYPAAIRACQPRDHQYLPPRNRQQRNQRHRPPPPPPVLPASAGLR
jgi:hypothetical protein